MALPRLNRGFWSTPKVLGSRQRPVGNLTECGSPSGSNATDEPLNSTTSPFTGGHATITAKRPNTGLMDDMIPTIDRGVFPLTEGGKGAANLVLHWMSAVTRLVREPGRSRR